MSSQWFTKKPHEDKQGPFSDKELKSRVLSGELLPTDLVWREGMEKAVPASNVRGLFAGQPPTPPPLPQTIPPPLVDPNSFDAFLAGAVPIQQSTTYIPNRAIAAGQTGQEGREKNEEEDTFTWYRPGDSRAPIFINWITFWRAVHAIGSKNKALYFVLPIIVTIPLGLILGLITSLIPLFIINWVILGAVCGSFGEVVFQCFRFAGINVKLLSMGYGFFAALLIAYFYFAGGLFSDYNRNAGKDDPPLGLVRAVMPGSVVWYVKTKAECMQVGKAGQVLMDNAPPPNRFLNYMFIFIDLFVIVLLTCSLSGGGRQNISSRQPPDDSTESEDEKIVKTLGIERF